jgi:hypothetical protein
MVRHAADRCKQVKNYKISELLFHVRLRNWSNSSLNSNRVVSNLWYCFENIFMLGYGFRI